MILQKSNLHQQCWLEYTFIRSDGLTGWPVSVQLYIYCSKKHFQATELIAYNDWRIIDIWVTSTYYVVQYSACFFPHDFGFLYIFLVIFVPTTRQSFFVRFKLCTSGNTNLSTKQQWGISSDHLPGRSVFYSDYLPASHRGRRIQPANAVLLTLIRSKPVINWGGINTPAAVYNWMTYSPAPASYESNIVREIQWRGVGWRNWSVTEGW